MPKRLVRVPNPHGNRYSDEPLRRNYSRLFPDSLSNYRYYFALLSIEHFLHCSLAALTVFFSFDQPIACLLIFFNWYDKVGLFFFFHTYFFQYIYFFPLTVIHCIFSSSNQLPGFFYHKGYYLIYIYIYICTSSLYPCNLDKLLIHRFITKYTRKKSFIFTNKFTSI